MVQLMDRFKYMHSKNFLHRDVKPDNFLMGLGNKSDTLYVVDMGLAKRYYDPTTQKHLEYRNDKSLTGTARYASVHAHLGEELSRRDDFEAIGYVMIYFYTGSLPWQNLISQQKSQRYELIKEMKLNTTVDELCEGCPYEFQQYLKHAKNLDFQERPDYDYMRGLFTSLAEKEGINLNDKLYDWNVKAVTIKNHSNFFDFI